MVARSDERRGAAKQPGLAGARTAALSARGRSHRVRGASASTAKPAARTATIKVGLITKDVTNPFFVKMKAGATAEAKKLGAPADLCRGQEQLRQREPDHRDREHGHRGREGDPDHRRRCEGRECRDREGAQGRRAGDRARLADRSDVGRRRALCDEQPQRGHPDRQVRPRRDEGQDRDDRHARRARRLVGRGAPPQRLHPRASGSRTTTSRSSASRTAAATRPTRRRRWRTASRRTRTSTSSTRSTSRAPPAPGPR